MYWLGLTLGVKRNKRQAKFGGNNDGIFIVVLGLNKYAAHTGLEDIFAQLVLAFGALGTTTGISNGQS